METNETYLERLIPTKPVSQEALGQQLVPEFGWLLDTIQWRWEKEFKGKKKEKPQAPKLDENDTSYLQLVNYFKLSEEDRLLLLLALAPFFIPYDLHQAVTSSSEYNPITYGARKSMHANQFLPTGTTALFLLAGSDLGERLNAYHKLISHPMSVLDRNLLKLGTTTQEEPVTNAFLILDIELIDFLSGGCPLTDLKKPLTY